MSVKKLLVLLLVGCGGHSSAPDATIRDAAALPDEFPPDAPPFDAAALSDDWLPDAPISDASVPDAIPPDAPPMIDAAPPIVTLVVYDNSGGTIGVNGTICAGNCLSVTKMYPAGTPVTVTAIPQNGKNVYFSGWEGPCTPFGIAHTCTFTITADTTVFANFTYEYQNLVFVSSQPYPANLAGALAYDQKCNDLATAAGINTAKGDGFIAWMSDSTTNAIDRANGAAGFIRTDGKLTSDTLTEPRVPYFAADLDENALPVSATKVWSSTTSSGVYDGSGACSDWNTPSSLVAGDTGSVLGGDGEWTDGNSASSCDSQLPIRCVAITHTNVSFTVPTQAGRLLWASATKLDGALGGGSTAADDTCQAEADAALGAGAITAKAWISTNEQAASALLDPSASYVRPDGFPIATGAALIAADPLDSYAWERMDGVYLNGREFVWSGAATPDVLGTDGTTCYDWTNNTPTQAGTTGDADDGAASWGTFPFTPCNTFARVICVQTAP